MSVADIALPGCDIVQLAARRGQADALGMALPGPGAAIRTGEFDALWIQPQAWLLIAPSGPEGAFAARITALAADRGAVIDQTHGRTVFRIAGPGARDLLARGCRIDLHPRAFGPGRVAATIIAQIGCIIHQRDDAPSFDLIVPSTLAGSFAAWMGADPAHTGSAIR